MMKRLFAAYSDNKFRFDPADNEYEPMPTYRRRKKSSRRADFIKAAVIVILIGVVVRVFVAMPYHVKRTDMESVLRAGDFLLVNLLAYRSEPPKINEVVAFEHPLKPGETRVGRVIALEGDTVEIRDKLVYVNGRLLTERASVIHRDRHILPGEYSNRDQFGPLCVPSGKAFVLGDNRDQAEDSRTFGPVDIDQIKGKAMFVYWSWKPDPNAPRWESPYIIPAIQIFFYNLVNFPARADLGRIGTQPK